MPWNENNYPVSMKNLPLAVRKKAIEIANAILEDRHTDEGIAIATGIKRAREWVKSHRKAATVYKRSK